MDVFCVFVPSHSSSYKDHSILIHRVPLVRSKPVIKNLEDFVHLQQSSLHRKYGGPKLMGSPEPLINYENVSCFLQMLCKYINQITLGHINKLHCFTSPPAYNYLELIWSSAGSKCAELAFWKFIDDSLG